MSLKNQCPICLKVLSSTSALKKHTQRKNKCSVDSEEQSSSQTIKNQLTLTPEQLDIISCPLDKNIRILAGAGCAKTTTIIYRVKNLIEIGIPSESIIMTTFTKDAANDIQKKLQMLIPQNKVIVGTIDSLSKRFLLKYNPDFQNNKCYVGEYKVKLYQFLSKTECPHLQKMISNLRYIFIDEYQDINQDYFNIISQMSKLGLTVTVVGDDCQNIYSWNGSNIKFILEFISQFSNSCSFLLTHNFRSTPEILHLANASIKHNENQIYKIIQSNIQTVHHKPTISYYYSWESEYQDIKKKILNYHYAGIPLDEIAILSRNCTDNGQLYFIETQLTKDLLQCCLLEGKKELRSKMKADHVCLSTIHKSKGLEWTVVFIIGCEDKYFPSSKDPLKIEEERRLFYVGITRPKHYLHLSLSTGRDPCMSRFVTEVNKSLLSFHNTSRITKRFSQGEPKFIDFSVTKIIENMKTQDYLDLKQMGFLPELKWIQKRIYPEFKYQSFISQQELFADFGIFIDNLVTRQLGQFQPNSNGCTNYDANKVIAKVVLDSYHYMVYKKYKINFAYNLRLIKQNQLSHIIHSLESRQFIHPDLKYVIKNIDRNDYSIILDIYNLLARNSNKFKIPIWEIPIFSENLLPTDFIQEMEKSYIHFTNQDNNWDQIIYDIYKVSRSSNILRGRSRLLYTGVSEDNIKSYLPMYQHIYQDYILQFCQGKNICKPSYTYLNISGELDAVCDDIIIDYKNSVSTDIPVEHELQLLAYCSLSRRHDQIINKLRIFNPIKGILSTCDISSWHHHEQLFHYLSQIRDQMMIDQNKQFQIPEISSIFIDTSTCLIQSDDDS